MWIIQQRMEMSVQVQCLTKGSSSSTTESSTRMQYPGSVGNQVQDDYERDLGLTDPSRINVSQGHVRTNQSEQKENT